MSTTCPKCHTDNPLESKFCNSCGLLLDSIDKMPVSQTKTIETPIDELTTGSTFAERYQIIEELGNRFEAIEHYEKFLDLWKDADPGLSEVEDAKTRLANLN